MPDAVTPLADRIARLARRMDVDHASIGVPSTGEACAAALLLGRLDLLDSAYRHPLDALDRIGPDWEQAVRGATPHWLAWLMAGVATPRATADPA